MLHFFNRIQELIGRVILPGPTPTKFRKQAKPQPLKQEIIMFPGLKLSVI